MRAFCTVLALIAATCALAAPERPIVQDGKPVASIVIDAKASEQIRSAAALLVSCVQESSGAKLPVLNVAPAAGTVIFIGKSPGTVGFKLDQKGLDGDGFDIAFPDDRSIVILGPTDWGTEFGVDEFLERVVGVRWLMPGPDGTDIPRNPTIAVPANAEALRKEPAFFSRLFSGLRGEAQADWARRNRMHGRVQFHHNLIHLFPPETYTKSHPEFFPIREGKRLLPPTNDTHGWQPCFSAPGIVEEAVKNINAFFDKHPEETSYSLGANDSSGYCQCEKCLAQVPKEKNFLGLADYSDLYYDWANKVIEGVLKTHPDKVFGCLAYSEVAAPPKHVKVNPRLIPYMTYDRMKWVDPELRKEGEAATIAWQQASPTVGWYDYIYGTPYCLPRVWFHHMADYYRFGYGHGVRALYAEAYPNWGEGPKLYISLKLQWNPEMNVDDMLKSWCERCVGEAAAPDLMEYYAHWEKFWTGRILQSKWFSKGGQYLAFYDPGYLADVNEQEIAESRKSLEAALAKAVTPKQKARAGLLLEAFGYYEASALAYLAGATKPGPITTEAEALQALDKGSVALEMAQKRIHLATEVFPKNPVLVNPLGIEQFPLLRGDSWGAGSLWAVYDLAAQKDGPVRARVREIAEKSPSETVRGQARLMLSLIENTAKPLTKNSSFEEGKDASATDWGWWVATTGTMQRTDKLAHTGKYSVVFDSFKRGGPVQVLDITPGKYGLVCFVYAPEGQNSKGTAELSMTLRNAKGDNLPSPSTKITPTPGKWTALAIAADVPAKIGDQEVKKVLPILIADGFAAGEKLYFDDLGLYRLGK